MQAQALSQTASDQGGRRYRAWPARLARLAGLLALSLALLAASAYLILRHYLWPQINQWRPQIEQLLSSALDAPVRIGELSSGFEGLRPSLTVRSVRVGEAGQDPPLTIESATAVLSLRGLARGHPALVSLDIERPVLRIERLERARLLLAGMLVDLERPAGSQALAWFLASRRITVRSARMNWLDRLGSDPMVVAGVDVVASSEGHRHHLSLRLPAVGASVQGLDFAADFVSGSTQPSDWRAWQGQAYVSAMQIEFAPLLRMIRGWVVDPVMGQARVTRGSGPLKAWLRFDEGRPVDLLLKAYTEALAVSVRGRPVPLQSFSVEALARWTNPDTIAVELRRLNLGDGAGLALALDERAHSITVDARSLQPTSGQLTWRGFDAARLLEALRRLPLPEAWQPVLSSLGVSGRISSAGLRWRLDSGELDYVVSLGFERLGLRRTDARARTADPPFPSFSNLSGELEFDAQKGRLTLSSTGAVLRFPGVFADPVVPLSSLQAQASWQYWAPVAPSDRGTLSVALERARFSNADLEGELSGQWTSSPRKGLGSVDLSGRLDRASAARVARYLPLSVGAGVRDWVARSITAGQSSDTRFAVRGDLRDFPFRDPATGEFRVESKVEQVSLQYATQWPPIERIGARLRFERASMEVQAEAGMVFDTALSATRARIDDFASARLQIDGQARGPTRDLLRFVAESGLRRHLNAPLQQFRPEGEASLELALSLGLGHRANQAPEYFARVSLDDNAIELDAVPLRLSGVAGRVEFGHDSGISVRGLRGMLLGGPIAFETQSISTDPWVLRAQGSLPASGLQAILPALPSDVLTGQAAYQVRLQSERGALRAVLESTLEGLGAALPEPFAKAPTDRWPLRLDWQSGGGLTSTDRLVARLREHTQLIVERRFDSDRPSGRPTVRAALGHGVDPVASEDGVSVALKLSHIDLDAWRAFFARAPRLTGSGASGSPAMPSAASEPTPTDPELRRVAIVADSMRLAGKTLNMAVLGASPWQGRWRGNVAADEVNGFFEWTPADADDLAGALKGRFSRLHLARSRANEIESMLDAAPRELPALDIEAGQLVLSGRELGRLSLSARNARSGAQQLWHLDRLQLDHPGAQLNASGVWQPARAGGSRATTLDFELSLREPARLLDTFGVSGALSGGPGRLSGRLHWSGSPLAIDYPSLSGEMNVALGKGQFLKSEPGLTKLIGVLSLQSLPRRLSLDFRDVFAEGFAFDDIQGKARIESGVARTTDFRMRGVQAQVAITGEADLAGETQQLRVEVRPEFNAGVASLAYAAIANPAIGLGSFIAQLALRKPLQDMFSYEYSITGPWADPNVIERARPRFEQVPGMSSQP